MVIRSESRKKKAHKKKVTAWHPLFVRAVCHELAPDDYDVLSEYHLSEEPLRIDIVVIRKHEGVHDDPEGVLVKLTCHFGAHTLIEFKGPSDEVSGVDLLYLLAYALLYCAQGACIPPEELTLMVVANRLTDSFRTQVKKYHGELLELSPGVHEVSGLPYRLVCMETEVCGGVLRVFSRQMKKDSEGVS